MVSGGVRDFTGKESYAFGDITEAAVRKATGNEDYKFGDFSRSVWRKFTRRGGDENEGNAVGDEDV